MTGQPPVPSPAATADLLLVNANVLTMDPARSRARSVAITGGRILAVDPDRAAVRPREVADLGGATVLPGFHDAHNHMAWFGLTLSEADLRPEAAGTLASCTRRLPGKRRPRPTATGSPAPATTRTSSALIRTGTAWTGPRPGGGSGCGTPPGTCAWSAAPYSPTSA